METQNLLNNAIKRFNEASAKFLLNPEVMEDLYMLEQYLDDKVGFWNTTAEFLESLIKKESKHRKTGEWTIFHAKTPNHQKRILGVQDSKW